MRVLASHQCGPGLIPGPSVIFGLSLLLVCILAQGVFGSPAFILPQIPTLLNPKSSRNPRAQRLSVTRLCSPWWLLIKALLPWMICLWYSPVIFWIIFIWTHVLAIYSSKVSQCLQDAKHAWAPKMSYLSTFLQYCSLYKLSTFVWTSKCSFFIILFLLHFAKCTVKWTFAWTGDQF